MNQFEVRQHTLDLLQKFKGLEPLKELLWSHLNYDRVKSQNITRRGWPEPTKEALAEDASLLAEGGKDGDFKIVYARLAKDRLSLADERIVTTRLLKDSPYAMFVFSDRTQTNWHFVNVKMAEHESKRKLYRRVTVGPNEKMRTACQVISQLDLSSIDGSSALAIQQRHDQAFDVEAVTEAFYEQYKLVFEKVEDLIRGIRDKDRKRLFTQRLFNRLMFIAFIQKKGWLQFGGNKTQDYLNALWADYRKNGNRDMGFYNERLYHLFFHGLGAQVDYDLMKINKGGFLREVIGKVPYLNGGLFEEDEDDKDGSIKVPDDAIRSVFADLFDHFNFTVTEATPLDVEVAVDPEMLGKVFEELVTGRHESGSYYTPKPIVSFMCREALKGYLGASLAKEKHDVVARFVDEHDPSSLRDAEAVLEALRRVMVCDPACGSGAYLLGMLHELMDLRTCLFSTKKLDPISAYDRKLEIIQRNIYGVDLDPFAVNIARLRLWLSLSVEFDGNDPPPLPNLKFEIEEGDSVSAPGPQPVQGLMREAVVKSFAEAKASYIKAHGEEKRKLETQVVELKHSISSWTHGQQAVIGFDWSVEFAEVFEGGGFDIIVANPPYVRMELIKPLKPVLRATFSSIHAERADLFCYFYARAIELLRPNGMISFISSNKWLKANYGANLRKYIAERCSVLSITDFGDLPVFKSATAYPMVFIAAKSKLLDNPVTHTVVRSLESPYPDVLRLIQTQSTALPPSAITGASWSFANTGTASIMSKMKESGTPLVEFVEGQILYGVKSGLNEAFVLDGPTRAELIEQCPAAKRIIKRLVVGKDIRKWHVTKEDRWLLYMNHGVEVSDLGPVLRHLKQFRTQLESRATAQEWYELQQPQSAYTRFFEMPKIVFPDIAKGLRFAFDKSKCYLSNTAYFIPRDDLYLLGVLNSSVVEAYYAELSTQVRGGYIRFFKQYMAQIPVPQPTSKDRNAVIRLVERCHAEDSGDLDETEKELDELISALYGLEPKDVRHLIHASTEE